VAEAGLAFVGFMHAGTPTPAGGVYDVGWATGWRWAVGYLLYAGFFAAMRRRARRARRRQRRRRQRSMAASAAKSAEPLPGRAECDVR
jgi:hypothetical protein